MQKERILKTVMPERLSLGSRKLSSDMVLSAHSLLIQPYLCLPCPTLLFKVKERKRKAFSSVLPFVTPWTVACQASLSMGILQARILEWVCHALLQGIFPTQGLNPGLLHCGQILYCLSHQGSLRILEWVACPFSSGSSQLRN